MSISVERLFSLPALIAGALALGGCGLQLESALKTSAPDSAFEGGLHGGYIDLAQAEYDEADYLDSDTFANRAIAVAVGAAPGPEEIGARRLPEGSVAPLTRARGRLVEALDVGVAVAAPKTTARAQIMFECWMERQEENLRSNGIETCRAGFMEAMEEAMEQTEARGRLVEADAAGAPREMLARARSNYECWIENGTDTCRDGLMAAMEEIDAALAPPPPPPPEPVAEPDRAYTIFFAFDSSALDGAARAVIDGIVGDWGGREGAIAAIGHADTAGPESYNQGLSERRAAAVGQALRDGGIAPARVTETGVGESGLAVQTGDEVYEPGNRRVLVTVE